MKIHHIHIATVVAAAGVAVAAGYGATHYTPPSVCHEQNGLPDSLCTPGATNPDITAANIDETICNRNWTTKSIRPPVSYTTPLKIQQIAAYGYSDTSMKSYEEDHLISLELGGSPTDPKNLWPEPYAEPYGAHDKDKVENELHMEVCNGEISLQQAQKEISTDWETVLNKGVNNNESTTDNGN